MTTGNQASGWQASDNQPSGWPAVRRSPAIGAVSVSSTTPKVRAPRSAHRGSASDVSEAALWEGPERRGQGVDRRARRALLAEETTQGRGDVGVSIEGGLVAQARFGRTG